MQMPDVKTELKDEANNFRYVVLAYRRLSLTEMKESIAYFYSQQPRNRRKLRRNGSVVIVTIHGHNGGF